MGEKGARQKKTGKTLVWHGLALIKFSRNFPETYVTTLIHKQFREEDELLNLIIGPSECKYSINDNGIYWQENVGFRESFNFWNESGRSGYSETDFSFKESNVLQNFNRATLKIFLFEPFETSALVV